MLSKEQEKKEDLNQPKQKLGGESDIQKWAYFVFKLLESCENLHVTTWVSAASISE